MKQNNFLIKNFKKAQHVLEFALLTPFLIAFFAYIVQTTWILNINLKFENALDYAILTSSAKTTEDYRLSVENSLKRIMSGYKAPDIDNIEVNLMEIPSSNTYAVIANYRFNNFFNLADVLFPNNSIQRFSAFSFINSSFLKNDDFSLNDSDLDEIVSYMQSIPPESESGEGETSTDDDSGEDETLTEDTETDDSETSTEEIIPESEIE